MNARKYMEEALMTLLKKKSIDKIKVSEVIREVGSCKGTFYKYYRDKYDMLHSSFENRVYGSLHDTSWADFMRGCLEAFSKMPDVALNAFDSQDVNSLRAYHETQIALHMERDLCAMGISLGKVGLMSVRICATGYTETMLEWLRGGAKESVDDLVSYMQAALPMGAFGGVMHG